MHELEGICVFNRNCFPKMKDFLGSRVHRKNVRIKEVGQDRHVDTTHLHTTNRRYHMAYRFLPFPMTLDDLEGHFPVAGLIKCNSTNIC